MLVRGSALAVFACTQAPATLLDRLPVVLVMRAFALQASMPGGLDSTVLGRALLDRLAREGTDEQGLVLPDSQVTAAWAGVLPPTTGWERTGEVDSASLTEVALQGAARVAAALPALPGEALVRSVRATVWGAEVAPGLPAAAAFAADAMGFLGAGSRARLGRSRAWSRLTAQHGEVFVRHQFG